MLISHEVPISLLKHSRSFNDYDYCLLHLTYDHPEYKQHYLDAIKQGRKVLLDNSLFELQDSLTNEQLAQGVIDLNPTWYVIPDCFNSAEVTIDRFKAFKRDYPDLSGLAIGVAQGSTLNELVDCYRFMAENADKIAIPFDSKAFDELTTLSDPLERWCVGRQLFIQLLVHLDIWNNKKPHHLLGCSYAKEFANTLYKNISIESCDTSNPITSGIEGESYGIDGLSYKPTTKLCELIDYNVTASDLDTIEYNVKQFRRICNGKN